MGVEIINQILMVLYVLSVLVVVRHVYNIIQLIRDETNNEKYKLGSKALLFLGIAVAYIITGIINGISI